MVFLSGLVFGAIIALVAAAIASLQMLKKWKAQGFAKAITAREKEIVRKYWKDTYASKKFKWNYIIGFFIMVFLYFFLDDILRQFVSGEVDIFIIGMALSFTILLLPFIALFAKLLDSYIRKSAK